MKNSDNNKDSQLIEDIMKLLKGKSYTEISSLFVEIQGKLRDEFIY